MVDLDRFSKSLETMQAHATKHKKGLRPHFKSNKCPEIAKRQIKAGAVGVSATKLTEALVLAEHGNAIAPRLLGSSDCGSQVSRARW